MKLREDYNKRKDRFISVYSSNNMLSKTRLFNNSQQMNTPVGNNELLDSIAERIKSFIITN